MSLGWGSQQRSQSATKDDAALMAWLSRKRDWEPSPGELPWGVWDWAFATIVGGVVAMALVLAFCLYTIP